jgi:hypothetical protein
MADAFPELPRSDCPFSSAEQAISGPMLPKPKWTQTGGSPSYSNPAYPHGGGPDDVPVAPPPMGQALPASNISPPTQTMMGGSGGGLTATIVQATADGVNGLVPVKPIVFKPDLSASPNFQQLTGDPITIPYFKL